MCSLILRMLSIFPSMTFSTSWTSRAKAGSSVVGLIQLTCKLHLTDRARTEESPSFNRLCTFLVLRCGCRNLASEGHNVSSCSRIRCCILRTPTRGMRDASGGRDKCSENPESGRCLGGISAYQDNRIQSLDSHNQAQWNSHALSKAAPEV